MTEVYANDEFREKAMAYVEQVSTLPAKSLRVSRALTHSPAERQTMKEKVRYEGEFLKERWFSDDAKAAMMAFVNKNKK